MKKYINCTFLFLIFYFIFNINCYASTNTFIRTDNNLRIPIDVVADSNNAISSTLNNHTGILSFS